MKQKKQIRCEVFSRVVGYHRPVRNWNSGKKSEFNQRKTFDEKTCTESTIVPKEAILTAKNQ